MHVVCICVKYHAITNASSLKYMSNILQKSSRTLSCLKILNNISIMIKLVEIHAQPPHAFYVTSIKIKPCQFLANTLGFLLF